MLLKHFAALLNRSIASSSRAQSLCEKLEGRSLVVTVQAPIAVTAGARVEQQQLHFSFAPTGEPDVAIAGTPFALLSLVGRDAASRLRGGAVSVTGDAEIAQSFHELLHAARPELEEELSRLVGDVAAHQLGNAARAAAGWTRKAAATFAANVTEYLQEESRDLVSRPEAEELYAAVDGLREAADRLAARLDELDGRRRP